MHRKFVGFGLTGILLLAGCTVPTADSTQVDSPTQSIDEITAVAAAAEEQVLVATQEQVLATDELEVVQESSIEESEVTMSERVADADVLHVRAVQSSDLSWTFHVTVAHPDTGWEDYTNGWDVVLPDGNVLKSDISSEFTRLLLHPHETEQPFKRSQSGIVIPDNVTQVTVRAHDIVDGFGGREVVVDLTVESGPDFEVVR